MIGITEIGIIIFLTLFLAPLFAKIKKNKGKNYGEGKNDERCICYQI